MNSRRIALLVEYDGARYSGWQKQHNARSIQGELENAFAQVTGSTVEVIGSGRTDAGVHAVGQVAHTVIPEGCTIPTDKVARSVNGHLARDIRVLWASNVSERFHARFDAISREYIYTVYWGQSAFRRLYALESPNPLDIDVLQEVAELFIGEQDFTTFSKLNKETKSYVCNVDISLWQAPREDIWQYRVRADRFVYGMVRALVGAMLDVARQKRNVEDVRRALLEKDRSLSSPIAPAKGLTLHRLRYPKDPFIRFRTFSFSENRMPL